MQPLTEAEKAVLIKVATQLNSMSTIMATIATLAPSAGEEEVTLASLRPSGRLDSVAEEIRNNTPISNEDLEALLEAAKTDIKFNSRLNGILVSVTAVAQSLRTTVLPLIMAAV